MIDPEAPVYQTINIRHSTGNQIGLVCFILGLVSVFFMAPIFVPLTIITGIVAIRGGQYVWAGLGLFCAVVGFLTSPILMGLFALSLILPHISNSHSDTVGIQHGSNYSETQNTFHNNQRTQEYNDQTQQRRKDFILQINNSISKMNSEIPNIDKFVSAAPRIANAYVNISEKMEAILNQERNLIGYSQASYKRGQMIYAINQGTYQTQQIQFQVQGAHNEFDDKVMAIAKDAARLNLACGDNTFLDMKTTCDALNSTITVYNKKVFAAGNALFVIDQKYNAEKARQDKIVDEANRINN